MLHSPQFVDIIMIAKLPLIVTLFGVLFDLSSAQRCANTCPLAWRCSPYYESLVWAIVDGTCRVFRNGCIFGSENCNRVNNCQKEMVATSQRECMKFCSRASCNNTGSGVCAWFPFLNSAGANTDKYLAYPNLCLLNYYSCSNGIAYAGEPTQGVCP